MAVGSTMNSTMARRPPHTAASAMKKFCTPGPACSPSHFSKRPGSSSASSGMLTSAECIR